MRISVFVEEIRSFLFLCPVCGRENAIEEDERNSGFARCLECDTGFSLQGAPYDPFDDLELPEEKPEE